MSKLETNTIDNISGSSTLNLGDTNATAITIDSGVSTLTIPNGITTGHMYPAFEATISGDKNMTTLAYTKAPFDEIRFDTNSAYDATTNYRFTVPTGQGGKYFVYSIMRMETGANTRLEYWYNIFYKNGSESTASHSNLNANPGRSFSTTHYGIIELAASDYIENYYAISVSAGTPFLDRSEGGGSNAALNTIFGAYRIGA